MSPVITLRRVLGISGALLAIATVSPGFSASCTLSPEQAQEVWGVACDKTAFTHSCQDVTGCFTAAAGACAGGNCNSSNTWTYLLTVTNGSEYAVDQAGGLDCGKKYGTPGTCGANQAQNGCTCSSGTNPTADGCTKDTYKPAQACPGG
ncbi:hypothetical protein [Schlesneria paludicola]|uniref:hypothetical protein n=1 Tax=Schlesneria paludicola TaxID=360056 RepID=UPI0012FA0AFA|nr:hypothetical protein [Schlesneria paludicola]